MHDMSERFSTFRRLSRTFPKSPPGHSQGGASPKTMEHLAEEMHSASVENCR